MAEFGRIDQKQRVFKTFALPGCFYVTDIHMKMYWLINVPFDSIGQNRPQERAEFGQIVQQQRFLSKKNRFSRLVFVTDGRRDLEICSYERSWRVDEPFDTLSVLKI